MGGTEEGAKGLTGFDPEVFCLPSELAANHYFPSPPVQPSTLAWSPTMSQTGPQRPHCSPHCPLKIQPPTHTFQNRRLICGPLLKTLQELPLHLQVGPHELVKWLMRKPGVI